MADVQQSRPPLRHPVDWEGAESCRQADLLTALSCIAKLVCVSISSRSGRRTQYSSWSCTPGCALPMHLLMQTWSIIGLCAATAGTSPCPPREAQIPNLILPLWSLDISAAGRLKIFLPGLGSQTDSILSWLCCPEVVAAGKWAVAAHRCRI